jgi:hypothetical protein
MRNKDYSIKTITELRKEFWSIYPEFKDEYKTRKRQNDYNATIRTTFVQFVDDMQKDNMISEKLAQRATL